MAGFALLMKARADDRRLFTAKDDAGNLQPPKLNVLSLKESKGLSVDELATHLAPFKVQRANIAALLETFEHAKTFGSLIQIPYALKTHLTVLPEVIALVKQSGDMYATAAADDLLPLVQQAQVLAMHFDAVVANPPYMGGKGMNSALKDYARTTFSDSKSDLFAMFMERGFEWCKPTGFNSMVTMQSWMFLSSYEAFREKLLESKTILGMTHMGNGVMGIAFGTAATVFYNGEVGMYEGSFSYCDSDAIGISGVPKQFPVKNDRLKTANAEDFKKIPGSPLSYWVGKSTLNVFEVAKKLGEISTSSNGVQTGDNGKYVRYWYEINSSKIGKKWFGYNKGGAFRRWYGNIAYVVDWENSGARIKSEPNSCARGEEFYLTEGLTWSDVTSGMISCRYLPPGNIFDAAGPSAFFNSKKDLLTSIGLMNTKFVLEFSKILNPTIHFQGGDYRKLPINSPIIEEQVVAITEEAIELSKQDWSRNETSFEFSSNPIFIAAKEFPTLALAFQYWSKITQVDVDRLHFLEEENNRLFIRAYGLQGELSPEVPKSQINLSRADRENDCQRLISYAIGCMMGRYSLDEPGLVCASAGNVGFEPKRYATFPADADGIVPITDELWFADDAPSRIREFLLTVWGPDTLEENMAWLAESLGTKVAETPDETIRRYIADKFFKDHLQTYKKRPIYWLFSSGKQGAFQALVYLHRYTEGTLARLRAEYVVPLTGKIQSRIEMLQKDAAAASSTAARNKLAKEVEKLKKKHAELLAYDEQLRHYADMRITLDLDDGVKVNYGKFGDLLAEVKAVTGGASDD